MAGMAVTGGEEERKYQGWTAEARSLSKDL